MSQQTPAPKLEIRIVPVTPLQQNTSMIWSTETMEGVFVDPGGDIDRLLRVPSTRADVSLVMIRPADVPTYVEHGAADLGVAGRDHPAGLCCHRG